MIIINSENTSQIEQLKLDEIAFPDIDYKSNQDLNLNSTTLLAAYTTISKRVAPIFLTDLNWKEKGDTKWQNEKLKSLSERIYSMIGEHQQNKSDFLLTKIFIWIQLWGGNSGRTIFIRGKKWPDNFKTIIYSKAVCQIKQGHYRKALKTLNSLYGISTAFSTKHIHFWNKGDAPIYDSIMAAIVFGENKPEQKDYPRYIGALGELANKLNGEGINRSSIERNLFNWANSKEGSEWRKIRLPKK